MQELKFDKEIHSKFDDIAIIDYGIVEGNDTIVFIKAGQNGSLYGYQNKYIKMAKRLNKKYGLPLTMTESEMTRKLGYYKIWDCGLIKYVWKNKHDE